MGAPSTLSYLAGFIGLNSLVFGAFALVPYYKDFQERLALWAVAFAAAGAALGFLDQGLSYLREDGHEQWPVTLSLFFTPALVIVTAVWLLRARKRAEGATGEQEHQDDS